MGRNLSQYPITQNTYRLTKSGRPVLVLCGYYTDTEEQSVIWRCEDAATGEELHVPESDFSPERPNEMEVLAWAAK